MIKIAFVVTGLEVGGAETMLVKLLSSMDRAKFDPVVIALKSDGALAKQIRLLDVPLHELGMSGPAGIPSAVTKLKGLGTTLKPNIVQGWMYHGNLAASIMHKSIRDSSALLWSIRVAADGAHAKPLTKAVIRVGARFSKSVSLIIYNSVQAANQHAAMGYSDKARAVVPNGFDTDLFAPSDKYRIEARNAFGIPHNVPVVGIVGRYHPMKNHAGFVEAAEKVAAIYPKCHFLFLGGGMDTSNVEITKRIGRAGIADRCVLGGRHQDLHRLYPAMDVHALSSFSEGFPNVLGEAMSCGIPCVATDVGDSGFVVGDTGIMVPKGDMDALANGIVKLLGEHEQDRAVRTESCRQRVIDLFSLPSVVSQYQALFEQAVGHEGSSPSIRNKQEPVLAGEKSN
jgi:glycosyltransferase involved in cell wall biosynthesis